MKVVILAGGFGTRISEYTSLFQANDKNREAYSRKYYGNIFKIRA